MPTGVFAFAFELNNRSIGAGRCEERIHISCSECVCVCANPHLWFLSLVAVAFHSPPVTIKKEPQSPGSDPNQSCSHKQSFSYPGGEQCLYARYRRVMTFLTFYCGSDTQTALFAPCVFIDSTTSCPVTQHWSAVTSAQLKHTDHMLLTTHPPTPLAVFVILTENKCHN